MDNILHNPDASRSYLGSPDRETSPLIYYRKGRIYVPILLRFRPAGRDPGACGPTHRTLRAPAVPPVTCHLFVFVHGSQRCGLGMTATVIDVKARKHSTL